MMHLQGDRAHHGEEDMEIVKEGREAEAGSWLITLQPHSESRERKGKDDLAQGKQRSNQSLEVIAVLSRSL